MDLLSISPVGFFQFFHILLLIMSFPVLVAASPIALTASRMQFARDFHSVRSLTCVADDPKSGEGL